MHFFSESKGHIVGGPKPAIGFACILSIREYQSFHLNTLFICSTIVQFSRDGTASGLIHEKISRNHSQSLDIIRQSNKPMKKCLQNNPVLSMNFLHNNLKNVSKLRI